MYSSLRRRECSAGKRSIMGSNKWLVAMVDNVIALTITMPVAAANPPRKTKIEMKFAPSRIGMFNRIKSGLSVPGNRTLPAIAMGMTKKLIIKRYNGNIQRARLSICSSEHSIMPT